MTSKWIGTNQLRAKKIYQDENDSQENVSKRVCNLFKKLDKYQIITEEINNLIYEELINSNIIYTTPIMVAGSKKTQTLNNKFESDLLLSACYLLTIDRDEDLMNFLVDTTKLFESGGFGCNISSLLKPIIFIKIIKWIITFYRGKFARVSVGTLCWEMYHCDFLNLLDYFDVARGKLNRCLHLNITFNDLFFKKVINDEYWYFLDYNNDLYNKLKYSHGKEFEELYESAPKNQTRKMKARELFNYLINYLALNHNVYTWNKDAANYRTMFNHETITTSNLCLEVIQPRILNHNKSYCTLGQINLSNMIKLSNNEIIVDYEKIGLCTKCLVYSLTTVTNDLIKFIPDNVNPHDIGIGISGYYDLLLKLNINYRDSQKLNYNIFQTIYYYALKTSNEIYEQLKNNNIQSYKLENFTFENDNDLVNKYGLIYNFEELRNKYIYNRRLTAIMPTSTSAEILGNHQSYHGPFSDEYIRETEDKSIKIKSKDNFNMGQLSLKEQLEFTRCRLLFLDNTQSNEIFYNKKIDSNLPEDLAEYYLLCYIYKIPTISYYLRVNTKPNNYIDITENSKFNNNDKNNKKSIKCMRKFDENTFETCDYCTL